MSLLLRSNLSDLQLETMLPELKRVIQEKHDEEPKLFEQIFNMASMDRSIVNHTQVSSLSAAQQVAEGEEIPSQRVQQGFDTVYRALKYGTVMKITREMMEDDAHNVIRNNPRRLARAMSEKAEIEAIRIFNEGFSTTLSDGKVLFATDHPSLQPEASDIANTPSAQVDLDIDNLEALLTIYRNVRDSAGNRIRIKPGKLLVPASLEFQATKLTESVMQPGGSNNDVNASRSLAGLQPMVNEYLTDDDAWFILPQDNSDHELWFYWRRRPEVETWSEKNPEVAYAKITSRFVVGASDFRGLVGTGGAP